MAACTEGASGSSPHPGPHGCGAGRGPRGPGLTAADVGTDGTKPWPGAGARGELPGTSGHAAICPRPQEQDSAGPLSRQRWQEAHGPHRVLRGVAGDQNWSRQLRLPQRELGEEPRQSGSPPGVCVWGVRHKRSDSHSPWSCSGAHGDPWVAGLRAAAAPVPSVTAPPGAPGAQHAARLPAGDWGLTGAPREAGRTGWPGQGGRPSPRALEPRNRPARLCSSWHGRCLRHQHTGLQLANPGLGDTCGEEKPGHPARPPWGPAGTVQTAMPLRSPPSGTHGVNRGRWESGGGGCRLRPRLL